MCRDAYEDLKQIRNIEPLKLALGALEKLRLAFFFLKKRCAFHLQAVHRSQALRRKDSSSEWKPEDTRR